jgi:3-hydroxy-3-methylglutaryl CoA synthase
MEMLTEMAQDLFGDSANLANYALTTGKVDHNSFLDMLYNGSKTIPQKGKPLSTSLGDLLAQAQKGKK